MPSEFCVTGVWNHGFLSHFEPLLYKKKKKDAEVILIMHA